MKHIIGKVYWNFEKEEAWLNKLSAKGLALIDYSWGRYVFEDSEDCEYIYRIELLEKQAKHPESLKYIEFMEETGVEHVASYMRWVYFRKKTSAGSFDIYSDIDSRIVHYKRILIFWIGLIITELCLGIMNLMTGLVFMESGFYINLIFSAILFSLTIGLMFILIPLYRKIKELKKEKLIRE